MWLLMRIKWAALTALVCFVLAGCAGNGVVPETNEEPGIDSHSVSDTQIEIYGEDYFLDHGTNNRPGESTPYGHVIAPGGDDDLAWAHYRSAGLLANRPVSLFIDVSSVIAPGGDDDLPLIFWIGVADYTLDSWQWTGPYTDDVTLELNNSSERDRYVSADYNMNFVILTDSHEVEPSAENPEGITAVEIASSIIITKPAKNGSYFATKPHFTDITTLTAGSAEATLTWVHIVDDGNHKFEANNYTIYRQKVGEDEMEKIAVLIAPTSSFNDPADAIPGKEDPIPGESYYYFLKAANIPGGTPLAMAGPITIPEAAE